MHKIVTYCGAVISMFSLVFVAYAQSPASSCNPTALTRTSYGEFSGAARALQQCLMSAGYAIPAGATGYYGSQTRAAVQAFYAAELALPTWDGNSVGPKGRALLVSHAHGLTAPGLPPTPPSMLSRNLPGASACESDTLAGAIYGARGIAVKTLQQCLMSAGYAIPAGATGYYGSQTRAAVQAFYRTAINLSDWNGNRVGPKGRAVLAQRLYVPPPSTTTPGKGYKRQLSSAELRAYLANADKYSEVTELRVGSVSVGVGTSVEAPAPMAPGTDSVASMSGAVETAARASATTVQVAGIDEPDIVKTDGAHIYVSDRYGHYYGGPVPSPVAEPMIEDVGAVPSDGLWYRESDDARVTRAIDAYPLENLSVVSNSIQETGDMLLTDDGKTLVIFSHPNIVGYDVSDPKQPSKSWSMALGNNTSFITARLKDGDIYLVTQTRMSRTQPCPLTPVSVDGRGMVVSCATIWVPKAVEPLSHTYTMMRVTPDTGEVSAELSIAGDSRNTVVSLFQDNLYLATNASADRYAVLADVLIEAYTPYVSSDVLAQAKTIQGYSISEAGKYSEIQRLFSQAFAGQTADERLRIQNEVSNRLSDLLKARMRKLTRTRITQVPLNSITLGAVGEIPGILLNQFSLDEYQGYVRAAVTVGGMWGVADRVNDVYVLDHELDIVGKVQDLGTSERIYAARFLGDVGYLVTFRQVDPFYVLDLSAPRTPRLVGELKIPGYSSYLEPLGDDLVLGVGREGSGVKLSVFDVGDSTHPVEVSKYQLADGWTEVEQNHHAFLRDAEHKIFFLPGRQGGYVFSYADGSLALKATIAGWHIRRAVYLDDYLYVIGDNRLVVLDENTWEQVKELAY